MKTIQWPKSGLVFEVPGKVRGKGRPRFTKQGITYTDKKTVDYERLIKSSYLKHTRYISDKSIRMSIYVCFAPNKSDSKKNTLLKLANTFGPKKKPDIDNVTKIVLDALNQIAYIDDVQVNEIYVVRQFNLEEKLVIRLQETKDLFEK